MSLKEKEEKIAELEKKLAVIKNDREIDSSKIEETINDYMKLAEKFHRRIITFIDTPGAYPGISSEENGIGEAIGQSLMMMSDLKVPIIVIITGEGGSGAA